MKIKNDDNKSFELNVKRFYTPFTITDECPNCYKEVIACSPNHYLNYPKINEPTEVRFYCMDCEDEAFVDNESTIIFEWFRKITIRVTAEKAD